MKPGISSGNSIKLVWIVKEKKQSQSEETITKKVEYKVACAFLDFSIDHCKKLKCRRDDQNLAERFVILSSAYLAVYVILLQVNSSSCWGLFNFDMVIEHVLG